MDWCSVLCMTVFGVLYVRISVYQQDATFIVPCYSYSPMLLLQSHATLIVPCYSYSPLNYGARARTRARARALVHLYVFYKYKCIFVCIYMYFICIYMHLYAFYVYLHPFIYVLCVTICIYVHFYVFICIFMYLYAQPGGGPLVSAQGATKKSLFQVSQVGDHSYLLRVPPKNHLFRSTRWETWAPKALPG